MTSSGETSDSDRKLDAMMAMLEYTCHPGLLQDENVSQMRNVLVDLMGENCPSHSYELFLVSELTSLCSDEEKLMDRIFEVFGWFQQLFSWDSKHRLLFIGLGIEIVTRVATIAIQEGKDHKDVQEILNNLKKELSKSEEKEFLPTIEKRLKQMEAYQEMISDKKSVKQNGVIVKSHESRFSSANMLKKLRKVTETVMESVEPEFALMDMLLNEQHYPKQNASPKRSISPKKILSPKRSVSPKKSPKPLPERETRESETEEELSEESVDLPRNSQNRRQKQAKTLKDRKRGTARARKQIESESESAFEEEEESEESSAEDLDEESVMTQHATTLLGLSRPSSTVKAKPKLPHEPKNRGRYTDEEIEALIDGVHTFGYRWAEIKKKHPILALRSDLGLEVKYEGLPARK